MNSIIWKGVSSTTIQGLLISELPPITKPEMRIKQTEIDGMDGSIIEELGYASYVKTITIGLHGNFDINKVIKYFTGEGDIVFSNEPDKVYKAKICGQIDYTRLLRYRQASIPFLVQPFKYKLNEYLRETPTETVSGTSIEATNRADDKVKSFKIYGKSTQNGTPTPSTPIDIVSIGVGGDVMVTANQQSIAVQTPNGLRGISVSSGGNYTDANGQQWICDEIDLARGVYVQRIQVLNLDGTERWVMYSYKTQYYGFAAENALVSVHLRAKGLCNQFVVGNETDNTVWIGVGNATLYAVSQEWYDKGLDAWKTHLNNQPLHIIYPLETPIEKPLTDEEIALYKTLVLNEPTITITNDENAYMMVEYFKPFEVFNEGLENSKPLMILKGSGTVEISVNGTAIFGYTFPEGENEVYIDSEKEDAYLENVLKNRNMNGEFPILIPKTNKIEWSGDIESISILPRSRWL